MTCIYLDRDALQRHEVLADDVRFLQCCRGHFRAANAFADAVPDALHRGVDVGERRSPVFNR